MAFVSQAPEHVETTPETDDVAGAVDGAVGAPVVPDAPDTADSAVDGAVRLLAEAMSGSLEEQVEAYELAHRTLQDRLADVEG